MTLGLLEIQKETQRPAPERAAGRGRRRDEPGSEGGRELGLALGETVDLDL